MATDNLILEHLTRLRNEIRDLRRDMQSNFHDVKTRLASLEAHAAGQYGDTARQNLATDELQARIERIEHRLEIADQ